MPNNAIVGVTRCPNCQHKVTATAVVNALGSDLGPGFWGESGGRWIVCQVGAWVHFRVETAAGDDHRLAYCRDRAARPVQERMSL